MKTIAMLMYLFRFHFKEFLIGPKKLHIKAYQKPIQNLL